MTLNFDWIKLHEKNPIECWDHLSFIVGMTVAEPKDLLDLDNMYKILTSIPYDLSNVKIRTSLMHVINAASILQGIRISIASRMDQCLEDYHTSGGSHEKTNP